MYKISSFDKSINQESLLKKQTGKNAGNKMGEFDLLYIKIVLSKYKNLQIYLNRILVHNSHS